MAGSASIEIVELREHVSELEGKLAQMSELVERFTQVTAGRDQVVQSAVPADGPATLVPADDCEEVRGSRRHLLKMAGATVIGAVAATLLDASPAAATTGTMMYGTGNDAGGDPTTLVSSAPAGVVNGISYRFATLTVENTSNGLGLQATDYGTGTGIPILGEVTNPANPSPAVSGFNSNGAGPGVNGTSASGYGVQAQGGLAPLQLVPAGTAGPPTTNTHVLGELFVDSNGVFYKCVEPGTPGVWVPLYSVVPLPAPVRVLDTTNGTGGITGPLVPSTTPQTTYSLTSNFGIPYGAVGLVGNLAVSGVNGALLNGYGVMTVYPAGAATPNTANINAGAGCYAISNSVTVALGTGANAGQLSLVWDGGGPVPDVHAFLDVSGYLL